MWSQQQAPSLDIQVKEYLDEIFLNITRNIILSLSTIFLLSAFWIGASQPAKYLSPVMLTSFLVILFGWVCTRLLQEHPKWSAVLWQAGMFLTIALALYGFQLPYLVLLYGLLPLIAVLTVGWRVGLLIDILMVTTVSVLGQYPQIFMASQGECLIAIIGGTLVAFLGTIAVAELLGVARNAIKESRTAREQTLDARRQRMELMQVEDDLIQANRELARLSDRLKALTQVAEDARRVKEEFVANVSHELRTPLNMIIGFSELIANAPGVYGQLPPALLADIAAIQRNSQHLAELVDDVLDLSQIEANRMALIKDWTTIQDLVQSAVSAIQVLYDTKNLFLHTEVPDEPVPIFCDRTRIREVLLNLLSNAGRYTVKGGVRVCVQLKNATLQVSVADTGPGIAPEDMGRLFEPFQQLDNSIRREGGTGLGLSISKRFVEMHEGKMWLESTLGEGTTFYFTLPMHMVNAKVQHANTALRWLDVYNRVENLELHRSKAPMPVAAPHYMILDQGNMLQRLLSRYTDDVELSMVQTLEDASQEIGRSPVQCLLINGASFDISPDKIERMNLPFLTPVITCWLAGDEQAAQKLGVMKYLVKPVNRERLLRSIEEVSKKTGRAIKTVLLVDDQMEVLQLFARILASSENPPVVLRARNGKQALQVLRERQPDIMFLDLVMQEMDGFQVINEKNRDESIRHIPTVVVSSKDPSGAPIVSNLLTIGRSGGISAQELFTCIRSVSEILAPGAPPGDRERLKSAPA